jgi:hypothetical protein
MKHFTILTLIGLFFISGCSSIPESAPTLIPTEVQQPHTKTPEPTQPESPSTTPTEKVSIEEMEQNISSVFEIFYDGTGCTVSGPLEISPGYYVVNLNDQTDEMNNIYISHLISGHKHQDLIDLQPGPGIYFPRPNWVILATKYFSFDLNNWIFRLEEPGEYSIYIGASNTVWFCSPLRVVE